MYMYYQVPSARSALGLERKNSFDGGVCGSLQVLHRFACRKGGFRCQNGT